MKKLSTIFALALAAATAGCAHQAPAYLETPRPQIPALPVDLSIKKDMISCLKLLKAFSTPPASYDVVCKIATN